MSSPISGTSKSLLDRFRNLQTRVRFPLALPTSLACREIGLDCSENRVKWPQFRIVLPSNRTGESVPRNAKGDLRRQYYQRLSPILIGEGFEMAIESTEGFSFAQLRETYILGAQSAFEHGREVSVTM